MVTRRVSTTSSKDSPVHRETRAADGAASFWTRSSDLLHWIWSWRVQFDRLRESTYKDGFGKSLDVKRRSFSRTSLDEHLLAVVGGHLVKAMDEFGSGLPVHALAPAHLEALRLLRNLYEHWDEQRESLRDPEKQLERSAKTFSELFPEGRPFSITYAANDWLLGGVVPLQGVTGATAGLAEAILELEREARTRTPE